MKDIKIIFFLVFIFLIKNYNYAHFYCEESRLALKEAVRFAKEVRDLQGLKLIATGEGGPAEIESLSLEFQDEQKLTVAEVRRIYVTLMERLIKRVNTVPLARPFFKQYPLKSNNFDIGIMYVEYDKGKELFISNPYVSFVKLIKGKIHYDTSPDGCKLVDLWVESYEDALRIVNEEATLIQSN